MPIPTSMFFATIVPTPPLTRCSSELTLRQHYVLAYADYLRADPALWRITVDYMYSCGEIGKEMGDQVLMRVPLRLEQPKDAAAAGEEAARIRSGQLAGVLKDINETCFEYQREEIRRLVCRVSCPCSLITVFPRAMCSSGDIDSGSDVRPRKRVRSRDLVHHISRGLARTRARCRLGAGGVHCTR